MGSGAEAYYKSNLDLVLRESKALKARLDQLEHDNRLLKRSLYDLNLRHSACLEQLGHPVQPFSLDFVTAPSTERLPSLSSNQLPLERNLATSHVSDPPEGRPRQPTDSVQLVPCAELKGHAGAVYSAQFAPFGPLLASVSFDRSVRLWDTTLHQQVACWEEHQLSVVDVCWTPDASRVLSAGYDHCVKEWDPSSGQSVACFDVGKGFIQAVRSHPIESSLFIAGSTSKRVYYFDRRQGSSATMELECEGKVNAVLVTRNWTCLSGDSRGGMREWDLRTGACLASCFNEHSHKPISSFALAETKDSSVEGESQLAVNSDDNVLRVYDSLGCRLSNLELRHAISGIRSEHWSTHCSLLRGFNYNGARRDSGGDRPEARRLRETARWHESSLQDSLLLASGSADPYAYVYDIGGPQGSLEMVQRLEGHTQRVCAAVFHSRSTLLATASADQTLRLWAPGGPR